MLTVEKGKLMETTTVEVDVAAKQEQLAKYREAAAFYLEQAAVLEDELDQPEVKEVLEAKLSK